ncbi:MAG TPA: sugar phosphate isomerase/epimerase [Terriglobales bacterium]|nr:sugar phosphate isomerase/epimerase [Terriglobales bacterium]
MAAAVPFDYLEWIYDLYGRDVNPLDVPEGVALLRNFIDSSGVGIRSVCLNYFMDKLPVCCTDREREERLREVALILGNARAIGVKRAVLPFLDTSAIRNRDDFRALVELLTAAIPLAEESGVELHLESSLNPSEVARLLDLLPHGVLKIAYDSGNSASLGFTPAEEFSAYGERIGSVHIKDRMLHGATVPLGTGNADFKTLFVELERVNYRGDFTLEVARGTPGDETAWARKNLAFLRERWRN